LQTEKNRISIKLNGSTLANNDYAEKKQRQEKQREPAAEEDALNRLNQIRTVPLKQPDAPKITPETVSAEETIRQAEKYPFLLESGEDEPDKVRVSRWKQGMRSWFRGMGSNGYRISGRPLVSTLVSLVSAVSLGLLFGFIVLTVFMQEQSTAEISPSLPGLPQASPALTANTSADGSQNPQAQESNTTAVPVAIKVPEQSLFMVQAGVFSDKTAANAAVLPLEKQGFPHLIYETGGKQHLFVATATTRDDTLGLASYFKGKQLEVYVKEVKLPGADGQIQVRQAASSQALAPVKESLDSFLLLGVDMARKLSLYSSRAANGSGEQSGITQAEEANLRESHRRFLEQSRVLQPALPGELSTYLTEMVNGMNQAVTALSESKAATASNESHAWQVQKGVLTFLESYVHFVQTANES